MKLIKKLFIMLVQEIVWMSDKIDYIITHRNMRYVPWYAFGVLGGAEYFCSSMRHLINYSGLRYETLKNGISFTHVENTDFFKSTIELEREDLKNIKRSKLFVDKYFE